MRLLNTRWNIWSSKKMMKLERELKYNFYRKMMRSENNNLIKGCTKGNIEWWFFSKCLRRNILWVQNRSKNQKKIELKPMIPSSEPPPEHITKELQVKPLKVSLSTNKNSWEESEISMAPWQSITNLEPANP